MSKKFNIKQWQEKHIVKENYDLNDLRQAYYQVSDALQDVPTILQDIKKKADNDAFSKKVDIDKEIKIFAAIEKLFNKSSLGKIL